MNSVLLMDKEPGITSFGLVQREKRKLAKGTKIGHAGTLDRFASGLMVILTGSCTRLCPAFTSFGKEYVAEIVFGEETDTLDPEGEVVRRAPVPTREALEAVLPSFIGTIRQVPPVYSAIHIDGERAYRSAREGRAVEMPARDVTISSLELLSFADGKAIVRAAVSKGTYIRSLARDIAAACGSAGRLENLRRTAVGPWDLADIGLGTYGLLEKTGLFSVSELPGSARKKAENGFIGAASVLSDTDPERPFCFVRIGGTLFGIGEKDGERIRLLARLGDEDM